MSVLEKVKSSVSAASWLTEADLAAIATAELLAERLDSATEPSDIVNFSKALQGVLISLGLTVSGRTGKAEPKEELSYLERIVTSADNLRKPVSKNQRRTKPEQANSGKASS